MVGTLSLSSGRAFARTRWLCPPYLPLLVPYDTALRSGVTFKWS